MKKEIYFGAGCFWGAQKYLALIPGVLETEVGYANGHTENPTYKEVCENETGFVEAVKVIFDDEVVTLPFLLDLFFDAIDPTTLNRQGGDIGTQYRSGIYYKDESDVAIIDKAITTLQTQYASPILVEVKPLQNYYIAEEYHQDYLDKNPTGYCHIGPDMFEKAKKAVMVAIS